MSSSREPPPQCSFEEALAKVEALVDAMETGQLGLTETLAKYEQGVRFLKHCYRLLEGVERKIELLSGVDAAGNPITQPLEDEELTLDEKARHRSQRRSRKGPRSTSVDDSASTDYPSGSENSSMDEPGTLF